MTKVGQPIRVALIGAGQPGLLLAMELKARKIPVVVFDQPMPDGCLRKPDELATASGAKNCFDGDSSESFVHCPSKIVEILDCDDGFWVRFGSVGQCSVMWVTHLVFLSGVRSIESHQVVCSRGFIKSFDEKVADTSGMFFAEKRVAILGEGCRARLSYDLIKAQYPKSITVFTRSDVNPFTPALCDSHSEVVFGEYDVTKKDASVSSYLITVRDDPYSRYSFDSVVTGLCFEPAPDLSLGDNDFASTERVLEVDSSVGDLHSRIFSFSLRSSTGAESMEAVFRAASLIESFLIEQRA